MPLKDLKQVGCTMPADMLKALDELRWALKVKDRTVLIRAACHDFILKHLDKLSEPYES